LNSFPFLIYLAIAYSSNDLLKFIGKLQKVKDLDFFNFAKEIFENVKQDMIMSNKLDPILLNKRLQKSITNSKTNITTVIESGFKVEGLSAIKMNNLKVKIDPNKFTMALNIGFTIPSVRGSGKYLLSGKAMKYIPIRGNGTALFQINQLVGKFDSILLKFNGMSFKTESLKINTTIGSLNLHLENLLDPSLSKLLNTIINFLAKPLVDNLLLNNKERVVSIEEDLKKSLNKQLSKYSIDVLMKKLNITQ